MPLPSFPSRILPRIAATFFLCLMILTLWVLTHSFTVAVINAVFPLISTEGTPAVYILKHFINLWGIVGIVIVLVYYGFSSAQPHDWRND